jgi:hypothetical protein
MDELYRKLEIGQKVTYVENAVKGLPRIVKPAFIESVQEESCTLWVVSFPSPYFIKGAKFDAKGFIEGTWFV